MKKVIGLLTLVLVIGTSLIAGTLAVYSVNLDTIAEGTVVAKSFALTGAGDADFATEVKIAPTETVEKIFTISNFEGSVVTETPMKVSVNVDLAATTGKTAIPYLKAKVFKVAGGKETEVGTVISNGVGTISFEDGYNVSASGQTYTYKVVIEWPNTNGITDTDNDGISNDAEYAGVNYGNTIKVRVSGTQVDSADSFIK